MDHPQTPRILAPHLSQFQHRIVRILGKVVQLRGDMAVIDAGGNVDVILNRVCFYLPAPPNFLSLLPKSWRHEGCDGGGSTGEGCRVLGCIGGGEYKTNAPQDSHLAVGHAVEIIGKVDGNLQVKVQAATDFGTSIGTSALAPLFIVVL
jgi:replication factor A3